ncbi:hypothetical protein [Xanthomonas sp. NCPPB 1128]|uniref:hypothetical protein n=1 Tax=Xanthomonas sp. NCPPB 1128 TaxID=1775876 RepID=UPI000A80A631|nr:hypothetical protein [Xanthomonas sp. NCPPB 1128]
MRFKHACLASWCVVAASGVSAWAAAAFGFRTLAAALHLLMWIGGAAFVLCCPLLMSSVLVLIFCNAAKRDRPP